MGDWKTNIRAVERAFALGLLILGTMLAAPASWSQVDSRSAAVAEVTPDRMNLRLVGHSTLNGVGKCGEGLALKQYVSRKVLILAYESGPQCFSIIDVNSPAGPVVLKQLPVEADFVRCNSLALSGNVLVVARQTDKVGQPYGGISRSTTSANRPTLNCFPTWT